MPNVGPAEILVILVVALLVFGPQKLPEIGRQVGKATRELRRMQTSLSDEVRDVLEPVEERGRPPKMSASTTPDERALESADEGGDEDLSPVDELTSGIDDSAADGDGRADPLDPNDPTTGDATS